MALPGATRCFKSGIAQVPSDSSEAFDVIVFLLAGDPFSFSTNAARGSSARERHSARARLSARARGSLSLCCSRSAQRILSAVKSTS